MDQDERNRIHQHYIFKCPQCKVRKYYPPEDVRPGGNYDISESADCKKKKGKVVQKDQTIAFWTNLAASFMIGLIFALIITARILNIVSWNFVFMFWLIFILAVLALVFIFSIVTIKSKG